jgi:malonate-semialdehyde dehydrogenase (acetylating) / methylmalonate-semialdehyde dehydrogenase
MTAQRRMQSVATHIQPVNYPVTHERISNPADTPNFLDNKFVPSSTTQWIDLRDPATNNLVTRVPQSTDEEMNTAVRSAEATFPAWKATSIMHKQQIILRLAYLIRENMDRLAASITLEQGKTLADARGDVRYINLPIDYSTLKAATDSALGASWPSGYRNSVRDHNSAHW